MTLIKMYHDFSTSKCMDANYRIIPKLTARGCIDHEEESGLKAHTNPSYPRHSIRNSQVKEK